MMHPKDFKNLVIDRALKLLWVEWMNLGVWSISEQSVRVFSDPESAIAFSEYFCKHERRLEKISFDWSKYNLQYINHSRLKRLRKAVANQAKLPLNTYVGNSSAASKYITEPEARTNSNLLIRLRLIFGSTTRAEVIFHLLTEGSANSNQIASHRFLNQKAVLLELEKLGKAGLLLEKRSTRERLFSIRKDFAGLFEFEVQMINPSWFLLSSLLILEECLRDELIDDEYLALSALMDQKRRLSEYLQKAGDCNISLSGSTVDEFYRSVTDYYSCLCALPE
jgi:hypothetical protein